jgi:signal transduction histidine kinase
MTSQEVGHDRGEPADPGAHSRKLVRQLAAAAGTRFALFGAIDHESQVVDAIAVWDGERFQEALRYELEGTPCADIVNKGLCVYPHGVAGLFPDDQTLVDLRIESYAGTPVRDGAGVPRAIVAVFDTREIDAGRVAPTLEVFAERARAELARRDAEAALERSERGKAAALSFLSRRDAILSGVAGAAERLLQAERWEDAVDDVLEVLGRATGSSRAYVFETNGAGGDLISSMRREWVAEGISPTLGLPLWQEYREQAWHADRLRAGVPSVFRTADDGPQAKAAYESEGTIAYVSVPIRARGRLWGYLGFDDCVRERPWSPLELEALRAAAGTIGAAMEREQSDARLNARERILEAVTVAAELLLRAPSWRDVMDEVLALLGRGGDASRCWLFETYEVDGAVHSRLSYDWSAPGIPKSVAELWSDRIEPPHTVAAFRRGETVQYLREELHPMAAARLEAEATLSIICVPVLVEGQLAAYIGYDDCVAPRRWSPAEEEALRAAASVLGSAMQTARGVETVRRRERMLGAVAAAAQRSLAALTAEEAVAGVLAEIGASVDASRVFVSQVERSKGGSVAVSRNVQWAAPGFSVADASIWEGLPVAQDREAAYERGEPVQGLARDADGAFRAALEAADTLSYVVVPIRAGGRVWGLIGFNDCVTERVWNLAEIEALRAAASALGAVVEREASIEALRASDERLAQARRMEAIGQLAAGLAHDLRNYLTVIVSYATFLRERVSDDGRADADALLETAGRVGNLVDRLLAFGRPQETVSPQLLDVGEVIRGLRDVIRSSLPESHTLSVSVTPELDPVLLDRGQLERVIVNLALNARDAMPDPGTLAIVARPDPIGVALDVADTGVGMDETTRDRVFEPFFTTKAGQGTGLGLAIVYGIVTRNGGSVEIASTPDAGTCVTVRLPRGSSHPAASESAPADPDTRQSRRRPLRGRQGHDST